MKQDKEITTIQSELSPIITKAKAIIVTDHKSMEKASLMLSELNKQNDRIDEEKQKVLAPLNQARTAEINRWKPIITTLEVAIDSLRTTISRYQTDETRRVRAEEAKIALRVGDGKGKLQVETAVRKIEAIDTPEEKISTDAGVVKFREDKILKITNTELIPKAYWIVDEKKLLADLKAGATIAGAELDIQMVPVNFR